MELPRHLLTVWNPSYTSDALDAHLTILLDWVRRADAGAADPEEDVYVWWGKIRSKNRDGLLPHGKDVLALDEQAQAGIETHLYLTDYRSLYVAHVGEVTSDDVRKDDGTGHMPSYYDDQLVDFWFRIWDIRRIITDDTPGTIAELQNLRNTRYFDHPVSIYGGMVELPLIVTRSPEVRWFSDKAVLADGKLWAERAAAHRSEVAAMSKDLQDNLFGRQLWGAMEATTRAFLASAETVFRTRRDEPAFDLSGAAVEYAKAVEVDLNALLFPALRKAMAGRAEWKQVIIHNDLRIDLTSPVAHQTLGLMLHLLEKDDDVQKLLRSTLGQADGGWLCGVLPRTLGKLRDIRNEAAHSECITSVELGGLREQVLGIGSEGVLGQLVRVKLRAG